MNSRTTALASAALISLCAAAAQGQAPPPAGPPASSESLPDGHSYPKRFYDTAHVGSERVELDGVPDELAWEQVAWAGDFIQWEPEPGAEPALETEFKLVYDDEALYFAARAWDNEPQRIADILARRDNFPGDWVEINIDSYHDHRTAFSFTCSVSGTRGDEFVSNDGNNWDGSWDPVWELATHIDDRGWTLEARIPFSQLRYADLPEQVWGFQVTRRIHREEQRSIFQPKRRNETGWVSHFAELRGLRGLGSPRRIELLPYGVAQGDRFAEVPGDPFQDGQNGTLTMGLDGKVGVTSDLTVDFTLNPDFGQVEADPSEVNLSAFETFFSERRPFFIEGNNILDWDLAPAITGGSFTNDNLFYSRRIGRSPQHYPDTDADEYVDQPSQTSILGAAKLTGKTSGGLSIGVLEAVTAEERATVQSATGRRQETVQPLTNTFVGRLQQDLRKGDTRVGAMFTGVNRHIDEQQLTFLLDRAYAGGVDLYHRFWNRNWYAALNESGSHVGGNARALVGTQTSSARYYQRPDNNAADLDTTRTSLFGHAGSLRLGKSSGGNFRFETGMAYRTPGYEINDAGFLRRANEINQFTWAGYHINEPFGKFRAWRFNANQWLNWDFDGVNLDREFNFNTNAQTTGNWQFGGSFNRALEFVSNTELRGGPASKWPGETSGSFWVNSDFRKRFTYEFGGFASRGDEDSRSTREAWFDVGWRPTNALRLNFHNFFNRRKDQMQYVETASFGDEDRYLFGRLRQDTYGITLRADYSVTPNLTVQYYGAPFLATGSYSEFKRITSSRADQYRDRFHEFTGAEIAYDEAGRFYSVDENSDAATDYAFDNPDFEFREFNSNLVVRWEFDPGSSLFLVWSQARSGFGDRGELSVGNDLDSLFGVHPHDVFLIKVAKWFSL